MDDRIAAAIARLVMASDMSWQYVGAPLYVCVSGGKDSTVLQQLAVESGIRCVFAHSLTTVDAPPTVYFVRREFERLRALGYRCVIRVPQISMWKLIVKKLAPPLRMSRYCCEYFKERPWYVDSGASAFIATGVRWAESSKRSGRGEFEVVTADKDDKVVLTNDNAPGRKLFEQCRLKGARVVNPIIDWSDDDVWSFIHSRGLAYNPLYDMGFRRVGCLGCPYAPRADRERGFRFFPGYARAYIRAFDAMIKRRKDEGRKLYFETGKAQFDFWMERG